MLTHLFNSFNILTEYAEYSEGWAFINFEGKWQDGQNSQVFKDIKTSIDDNSFYVITWHLDGQAVDFETFIEDLLPGSKWDFNINKLARLSINMTTFFFNQEIFKEWSRNLDAFDTSNPLLSPFKLKIFINGFREKVVATNYMICNPSQSCDFAEDNVIPSFSKINSVIHIVARENFIVEPSKLYITEGDCTDMTYPFFRMAVQSLAVCIVSELLNNETVVLRGIRKIEMFLYKNTTKLDTNILEDLKNTVMWIYEDKTDLKLKLYLDRFTLDVDLSKDYTSELILLNRTSIEQAKERFSFITFERKDQYQKELRDLLKDIKGVSDLYSAKVRGLLSSLLRDVLAGLLLIGITILSKIDDVNSVTSSSIINLVFKAFAVYFVLSIVYQTIFDVLDINNTKSEFIFWKQTSREYIGQDEFKKLMEGTIRKREIFTFCFYGVLIITYLVVACVSYNFIYILKNIISASNV